MTRRVTGPDRTPLMVFNGLYLAIEQLVSHMPDEALRSLDVAAKSTTNTNCAWYEYRVSQIIKPMISDELALRARAARVKAQGERT